MAEQKLTGIYFCDTGNGHAKDIDINEIKTYLQTLREVVSVWEPKELDLTNFEETKKKLENLKIERMIIAGQTPGVFKAFFARALNANGKNGEEVVLASFKEHLVVNTQQAKTILTCAFYGVSFTLAAMPEETEVHPDTLVIGGGIAGIQASLEIADAGQKVYLLEKTGTIGGHMAMFDKTFPTLDCAACILTPKMVEVGQHANIEMLTYSEVKSVSGGPGNYKVKVLKKARRVNVNTCIGCGTCAEKCPGRASSEFDAGTTMRKAIYIPFAQAVPNKYLIDEDACLYVKKGKCSACVKVCPVPDCINLDEKDAEIEITVGNIIVSTGFKPFDAKRAEQFGYGRFPNVVTSLELERLINAGGPTSGEITFRSKDKFGNWVFTADSESPKSVAIVHCVGSRDEHYNKYCSTVCCMYSLKLAHLVKEKLPETEVHEYYIDMRAFGKGYEEFYNRIKDEGINVVRGSTVKVEEEDGKLLVKSQDIHGLKLLKQHVDMVVLAVGLEPREETKDLSQILGVSTTEDGWFKELSSVTDPVNTNVGGVAVAGVCHGPKDIPDTVAQASAAASRVIQSIIQGKIKKSVKDMRFEEVAAKAKQQS
ncbi:MAG: CoB--CoM heterodisulfide reductase iron-sulfur subunit A family protein [bacterium]|nr:CoB--CoM heterodisulfide reductase iron-sulfur subunit A family protein [bacterium]MBU1917535.1 CoB--CoM heterodisulfide reductase iron-sulfur subunit A family protein [bacterium]